MDISALRAFLAIAETGSFSRAADAIFVSQPAISKRIAGLEDELGARLFDRIGRRVQLTPVGQALVNPARAILNDIEDAKRRVANLSGEIGGRLGLGTSHHVGLHRLPPALKRFHQDYPGVHLDLRFMDSETACGAVERGELELAIVTLPTASLGPLNATPVWDDPLEIVVGNSHPLATKRRIDADALVRHPAVLPGIGTFTRELILAALGSRREQLRVGMSTNYLEVLKMLVAIGLGWSALPHTLIDDELKVVHIKEIKIRRELGVVTHSARTLSNAAQAMIRIVNETK
ncbi:MAG: LysR family transcriptional regulator [Gammaproteobacteria bacterium]|nr:LysR family transcriptional regulator [Gammaproteobacteria bacterium]